MITSQQVKQFARSQGADLVGVGNIERWEGAPEHMDPRNIFPDARSAVVIGLRIPRGCYRGIEEGTLFTPYPFYGYKRLNANFRPLITYRTARFIEESSGYEAVPVPPHPPDSWPHGEPVAQARTAPDVYPQFRIAAVACGLGEIGYSKVFLSPEFGPRQRLGMILTDAELEPDPLFEGQICDRCGACVATCPAGALLSDSAITINIAGKEMVHADIDCGKCHLGHWGASPETSPFVAKAFPGLHFDIREQNLAWGAEAGNFVSGLMEHVPFYRMMWTQVSGFLATCGARGCIRSCMDHLERTGRIAATFNTGPFRKRPMWSLAPKPDAADDQ